MTREEAIYLLKNTAWLAPSLEPVDEAINMAIEALQLDLVLCKDCRYYRPEFYACTADGWNLSATHYPKVHESGYCYRRKRRSDETDTGKHE